MGSVANIVLGLAYASIKRRNSSELEAYYMDNTLSLLGYRWDDILEIYKGAGEENE